MDETVSDGEPPFELATAAALAAFFLQVQLLRPIP